MIGVLAGVEMIVSAPLFQQLPMGPLLHHFAILDHQDEIGAPNGGETMGDDKGSSPLQQRFNGFLNKLLGLSVDGGGRLVEHKDGGVGQDRPGKRDELLFSGGETVSPLAHVEVIALRL